MRELLNNTGDYGLAAATLDAVDRLLAVRPDILGLAISPAGLTFEDEAKNAAIAVRYPGENDSGYNYSVSYANATDPRLCRADFSREGFLIHLTYKTAPLDEHPAIRLINGWAERIPKD